MDNELYIRKIAVLGAGVMGAQIAGHFANSGIEVNLFDLKSGEKNKPNAILEKSITTLKKLTPKPLVWLKSLDYITIANYTDNLDMLKDCDLIIEAIAEKIEWKEDLYKKVAPFIHERAIIASNTSGLSIELLASCLPKALRENFCGIHFFNPPRYMSLVELIPHKTTSKDVLSQLETFLVTSIGKNVILAKDTPNFIANRLGVFSMLATCIHTEQFNIPLDVVDKLTGKNLGRAKSATYRTADVVGLDTFAHVVSTMSKSCHDGFESYYELPVWIAKLIEAGSLGQKTKVGFYKKDADGIKVLDLATQQYRLADKKPSSEVLDILHQKGWALKFDGLRASKLPEAKFLWACFRDIFHYAAVLLGQIADSPLKMDLAIRWGFGWKEGIFEIWQQAGWNKVAAWIKEDIDAGLGLSRMPLPEWVFTQSNGVYLEHKHFNILENKLVARKALPVYKRQLFPDMVLNEVANVDMHTLYENDGVRLWHSGDNIGVLSFKTKMCTINMDVLVGIEEAIIIAEQKCVAMVIWQEKEIFSAGANLEEFGFSFMMNGADAVDEVIGKGHQIIARKIRYSKIPVVAAVRGYAFGGGCEIMLHCDAVVAAMESYIGLVEAGVGLLPGWGGTTEMAYRAAKALDPWKAFEKYYKNLALAQVATSAREAQEMGFLHYSDNVVMNTNEVLFVAKSRASSMAVAGYRPPLTNPKFKVFGEQGIANVCGLLANMLAGRQISEHDYHIAKNIAIVMCGGYIEKDSLVSESWLLEIEQNLFKELALTEKTSSRIQHMLETGKPLRN